MVSYDNEIVRLLQQSLGWEYYGGSHFQRVCHPETEWRQFPFLVIVCPTEGRYFSEIENFGRVTVQAGEALLVPAGLRHTVGMPEAGVLHHAHLRFTLFGSTDVLRFFEVPYLAQGAVAAAISEATRDLHVLMTTPVSDQQAMPQAIRLQEVGSRLLALIADVSEPGEGVAACLLNLARIERPLRHLEKNLASTIHRHDLAKLASLSATRFHYVFKGVTGMSPMAYLKSVRMRKAQCLLFQTGLQIAEIGAQVGYPDLFHFSKTFRGAFRMSPSDYRRKSRQGL